MPIRHKNPRVAFPGGGGEDNPNADWRQFLLADADGNSDPNSIIVSAGETDGITQFSVNSGAIRSKLNEIAFWYIDTGLLASDLFIFNGAIEFTDADAGGPGTTTDDEMIVWMGLTSNPADMANRAAGAGYEHGPMTDPRACLVQGSGSIQYGGSPPGSRHQASNMFSMANQVSTASRSELIDVNMSPAGSQTNQGTVNPASPSDKIYLFVGVGCTAAASYLLNCRFYYALTKALTPF